MITKNPDQSKKRGAGHISELYEGMNAEDLRIIEEGKELLLMEVDAIASLPNEQELSRDVSEAVQKLRAQIQRGIDDMEAGRYTKITNAEEARALADDIKRRGRELRAKREASTP